MTKTKIVLAENLQTVKLKTRYKKNKNKYRTNLFGQISSDVDPPTALCVCRHYVFRQKSFIESTSSTLPKEDLLFPGIHSYHRSHSNTYSKKIFL